MTHVQHTPGPWTVSKHSELPDRHFEITSPDAGLSIADVGTLDDALLLVAAPLLLEALELAEATISRLVRGDNAKRVSVQGTRDVIRDVITRALTGLGG